MANLLDCVENSVWHAFDYLALEGDGTAQKFKLKTLTSEIGTVLELKDVDKGIDDYRSTPHLTFDQYRYYLSKEVFSALPEEMSVPDQRVAESKLDEVFWNICKSHYIERDKPIFPDDCVYKLFRIFSMLGEMVENDEGQIEVAMAAGEVENVAHRFLTSLGRGTEWDPEDFDSVAAVIQAFKFGIFLTILESKYAKEVDEGGLKEAVSDIHDYFVVDVIKKGHMGKKMDLLPAFREHFFVLQPHCLAMYAGSSEKDKRGEITLDGQCRVEAMADLNSKSPLKKPPGAKSHSRFQLFANEKIYEFQASDHRTRLQWMSSLRTAIEYAEEPVRYQRSLFEKRKLSRQDEKEKEDEEYERIMAMNNDTLNDTQIQLEQEKQARVHAEVQAQTLQRQRVIEEKKMREMEKIREQLEKLLDEERQAKKDEEIVRTLQARILNEEWARRETLEKLQEEQKKMLEAERKKREEFEKAQNEKERELKEAQSRVEEMEKERKKLDKQLDHALEKAKAANHGQEVLETKIKIQEQETDAELDKEAASRVTSLNPSASFYVKNRDRPSYMPMRSASMRETSYSRSIRRRQKPSTNTSTLSVANAHGGPGSMIGDHVSNTNVVIEENNSTGSGADE